jgi:hypothetical protein
LDWRAKVELFEQIRREYEFGIGTIVGVAKTLGVHRRMVREAIGSALPRPRKKPERPRWKLQEVVDFVDAILEADRKERHANSGTRRTAYGRGSGTSCRRARLLSGQCASTCMTGRLPSD